MRAYRGSRGFSPSASRGCHLGGPQLAPASGPAPPDPAGPPPLPFFLSATHPPLTRAPPTIDNPATSISVAHLPLFAIVFSRRRHYYIRRRPIASPPSAPRPTPPPAPRHRTGHKGPNQYKIYSAVDVALHRRGPFEAAWQKSLHGRRQKSLFRDRQQRNARKKGIPLPAFVSWIVNLDCKLSTSTSTSGICKLDLHLEHIIVNFNFQLPAFGSWISNFRKLGAGSWMLEVQLPEVGSWVLEVGFQLPEVGSWARGSQFGPLRGKGGPDGRGPFFPLPFPP